MTNLIAFISDLHLHPQNTAIDERFNQFIDWAKKSIKTLYILGDFLHAWPGDDALNTWSKGIATKVYSLKISGINVFYMHGNRDFLLGTHFTELAGWTVLKEPTVIHCGDTPVLLVHGDGYCTKDISHQIFRLITRTSWFRAIFKQMSLNLRLKLVDKVRNRRYNKVIDVLDVVPETFLADMQKNGVLNLIHGHTHKCNTHIYNIADKIWTRYVLSDWDDNPQVLCYDVSCGFYFNQSCVEK